MTRRLKSKHKVDRRLKVNLWGRPKSPFNSRAYPPGQHGKARKGKPISLEVFGDTPEQMLDQAKIINSWGKNIYVKVPVVNLLQQFFQQDS